MPLQYKDYYKSLGVPRDANDADIKKAFRKLAREFHPDVAKNKKQAEEKFKEINEAYEVLGDAAKRKRYDELGANWQSGAEFRPPGGWESFGRGRTSGGGGPGGGEREFHFDGTGFSDFFEQIFGSRGGRGAPGFGGAGGFGEDEMGGARGQDIEGDILVTLDEILRGSSRTIRLQRTDPLTGQSTTQTLRVKIPPGVREGQLIRVAGKGQEGIGGGESGNLYLRVKFAQHPDFRVRGANLYYDLDLAPWEAVLGATVRIPTLDGTVSLKIPAGTVSERQFRLRGKGLPTGDGTRGDLYAVVSIEVPSHLTSEQKVLWEQLAAKSAFNPRKTS